MFDWENFFVLALHLRERGDSASQRSAISRAYYAAFHAARTYLIDVHHESVPSFQAHAFVWDWFTSNRPGRIRLETKIGHNGKKLRARREDADYEARFDANKELEDSLERARAVLTDLAHLVSAHSR